MNYHMQGEDASMYSISSAKDEELIESKQLQIVHGALKLFFEQGFHPTTIRQIAETCNMSMGQLYHYISSKDDVLYLVHKYFHDRWLTFIEEQKIEQYKSAVERLARFLEANIIFISNNRKLIRFISTETKYLKKDYLKNALEMEQDITIKNYYNLLVDVNEEKPINADLEILASLLAYSIAFYSMKSWTVKNKSAESINREVLVFVLKGLGNTIFQEAKKYCELTGD